MMVGQSIVSTWINIASAPTDGIQIVTSQRNSNYSVPVKTPVVYYLLDLFCRAMIGECPSRSNADVIATVRGVYI